MSYSGQQDPTRKGFNCGCDVFGQGGCMETRYAGKTWMSGGQNPCDGGEMKGLCVNGTDPFMMPQLFLEALRGLGFAGIQNVPTVGLIDGHFRCTLEETGMSYQLDIDLVKPARDTDFLTTPYVFDNDEARAMTEVGADIDVAHMRCTIGGTIGVETATPLDECIDRIGGMVDACRSVRDGVIMFCHAGPIVQFDDARYILDRVDGIEGLYGASSVERLPKDIAIRDQVQQFKAIKLKK